MMSDWYLSNVPASCGATTQVASSTMALPHIKLRLTWLFTLRPVCWHNGNPALGRELNLYAT